MTRTTPFEASRARSGLAARVLAGAALAAALLLQAGGASAQVHPTPGPPQCPTAGLDATISWPGTILTEDALRRVYRWFPPVQLPSKRIECWYGVEDNHDRRFVVRTPRILITEDFQPGIHAWHQSMGNLEVYVHAVDPRGDAIHFHPMDFGNMAVRTTGSPEDYTTAEESHAVHIEHDGEGDGGVGLDFRNLSLMTTGDYAYGIYVYQRGRYIEDDEGTTRPSRGRVQIRIWETERDREGRVRPLIATRGDWADAVRAEYERRAARGDVVVDIEGYTIATGGIVPIGSLPDETYPPPTGRESHAVFARHGGLGDVLVSTTDAHIFTWGPRASGIIAQHLGSETTIINEGDSSSEVIPGGGRLSIAVSGGEIRTWGDDDSYGVYGRHAGDGEIDISLTDASLSTAGPGVYALHQGASGGIDVSLEGVSISGTAGNAHGVIARRGREGEGALAVAIEGGVISTTGEESPNDQEPVSEPCSPGSPCRIVPSAISYGVWGWQESARGGVSIALTNAAVSTESAGSHGVYGLIRGRFEVTLEGGTTEWRLSGEERDGDAAFVGAGDLAVTIEGGSISTAGEQAHGVFANHHGDSGALAVTIEGGSISTTGFQALGVYAWHHHEGAVALSMTNAIVRTAGERAWGVRLQHTGEPEGGMSFRMKGGEIRTTGDYAHGLVIQQHNGGEGSVLVSLEDAVISTAGGEDAVGIDISAQGGASLSVSAGSRVSAASGLAVLSLGRGDFTATVAGTVEGDLESGMTGESMVTVSRGGAVTGTIRLAGSVVNLGGVAGRVWLEGGGTVTVGPHGSIRGIDGVAVRSEGHELRVNLSMNNRRLADVINGAIVNDAPEETTVVVNGVRLYDGANGVIPVDITSGPFDVRMTSRSDGSLLLVESYAPRAGVYEALPGLLLRLSGAKAGGERKTSPGSPVSASVWGGEGSRGDEGSDAGASYDFDHSGAQADLGLSFWIEGLSASVSVRHLKAQADVSLPSGKGEIKLEGAGFGFGLSWENREGFYLTGDYFHMEYDADLASSRRGSLKTGLGAAVRAMEVEGGMRFALHDRIALIPRAWAARTTSSIDDFTDPTGSRVRLIDGDRTTGGAGVAAETEFAPAGGWKLSLRGALDVESALSGDETTVDVAGHRVTREAEATRILMGLDALWRMDSLSLGGHVRAGGLGSDDETWSGRITLGLSF